MGLYSKPNYIYSATLRSVVQNAKRDTPAKTITASVKNKICEVVAK